MVLRVTAQLCRENCTYLAGETVRCKVTLENAAVGGPVSLTWCSAQIVCRCAVNDTLVKLPKDSTSRRIESGSSTSFCPSDTEKGQTVLALAPSILCCDLTLPSGVHQELLYTEHLPFDIPASYNGRAVRYFYKLIIGVQPSQNSSKLLRLAFRVLVVPGLSETIVERYEQALDSSPVNQNEGSPTNPFLRSTPESDAEERRLANLPTATLSSADDSVRSNGVGSLTRRVGSEPNFGRIEATVSESSHRDANAIALLAKSNANRVAEPIMEAQTSRLFAPDVRSDLVLACASHMLGELAGATSLHQFTIATRAGRVCRFYLHKAAFRLGESVVGAFDFAGCDVRSHRVVVHLESEERIDARFAARAGQPPAHVTGHATTQQTVACLRTATFDLEVPSDAPVELVSELVTVQWRIRFEFHVLRADPRSSPANDGDEQYTTQWRAPSSVETQATEWTLPIRVFACSPLLSAKTTSKSVVQLTIPTTRLESGVDVV